MSYRDHFAQADDLINHLKTIMPTVDDPMLQRKYIGFVSVTAITVYELAIKQIFKDFAEKKHTVLGNFTKSYFKRINGRIALKIIKEQYVASFGEKYLRKFKGILEIEREKHLRSERRDFCSSYANLILWRNEFAHEGKVTANATFDDVVLAYEDGKKVIDSLNSTMYR